MVAFYCLMREIGKNASFCESLFVRLLDYTSELRLQGLLGYPLFMLQSGITRQLVSMLTSVNISSTQYIVFFDITSTLFDLHIVLIMLKHYIICMYLFFAYFSSIQSWCYPECHSHAVTFLQHSVTARRDDIISKMLCYVSYPPPAGWLFFYNKSFYFLIVFLFYFFFRKKTKMPSALRVWDDFNDHSV